jgi:hypothetical protein
MSQPPRSPPQASPQRQRLLQEAEEIMRQRMEMGEFGIQPNFDMGSYHQAYAQLVAQEPTDIWHDVCGLWQGRGRVLYEHKGIPEDVMIPAGAKILILRHDPRPDGRPDQPVAQLKYITVGYQTGNNQSGAPPAFQGLSLE